VTTLEDLDGLFSVEELEEIQPKPPPPIRLEDLPMRALDPDRGEPGWDRHRQFREWVRTYGHFGCVFRSHGWSLCPTSGSIPQDRADWPRHDLREFTRHLGCQDRTHVPDRIPKDGGGWTLQPSCYCVGGDLAMVACACGWESSALDARRGAGTVVLEGLDHIWPGWRSLPVLSRRYPDGEPDKIRAKWLDHAIDEGYELEWLEAGGPFLTERTPGSTRHVAGSGPTRASYDVGCLDGVPQG
jgi:hypothetical protein